MNDNSDVNAQLRAMALDFALRTPGLSTPEGVIDTAVIYADFMLGKSQEGTA